MDPDFQLQSPKRSALEEGIRSAARRAFFDAVREDFAVGEYGRYAVGLIDEAKKASGRRALISMLRENGSVAQQINEVLDLELISQQISRRIYDMRQSTGFILGKMLQLCAPARDGAIRDLVAIVDSDLAGAWDGLLTTLDDMKLDLANFRLQQLRPQLATEAVSYESRKFDEALEAGRVTLHRTREWLQSAAMSLLTVAAARNPESSDAVAAPRFEDVYNEGLLSLVFGSTAVNAVNCPETLSLDADRIFGMQNEGQAITIVAALLVLSKNLIAELRSNDAAAGRLKSRLMTLLRDPDGGTTVDNLSVELVATMNAILAEKSAGSRLAAEQEALVKSMVDKTLTYKDTVFTMMSRRVQDRVRQTLQSGTLPTAQSLVSSGLDAVAAEVSDLCKKVTRLARHDREVHAKHYDAIIRAALSS
ncbi:T-complex 11 [Hyaloraphidium curvatum]|nr:T-complex 11 [Hyaloraphidium curvatum]